jgi:alpha-aminoadipate carrier protein LysW
MSVEKCVDCDAQVIVPDDAVHGEIVSCADCGLDFEVVVGPQGRSIKPVVIEKEDWGE